MPILPFPLPVLPGGGDLPVKEIDDCRAALPSFVKDPPAEEAPVREALIAGETAMFLAYQERSAYAAAQSDPTRATGIYLQGHAEDRGVPFKTGEDNEQLRARMFQRDLVAPSVILAAANAILAPLTTKTCQLFESCLDRMFLTDGTAAFHTFLWDGATPGDVGPTYTDRQYVRRDGDPGGSWAFDDRHGRYFVLRVPVITAVGTQAHMFDETTPPTEGRMWLHNGTDEGGSESSGEVASFLSASPTEALQAYQAIADAVTKLVGAGVRWMLIVDPKL